MACWGKINQSSELYSVFGDIDIPILSIVPMIPRERGCPLCYVVLGSQLDKEVLEKMAQKLFERWQSECESLEMAKAYIKQGLPVQTSHFQFVSSDDRFHLPTGIALNLALHQNEQN